MMIQFETQPFVTSCICGEVRKIFMLELLRVRYSALSGKEKYHLLCLSLFVLGLPILNRPVLSYIIGVWLVGAILQVDVWRIWKNNWKSSKAYKVYFALTMLFMLVLFSSVFYSDNLLKGIHRMESHLSLLVIPIGLFLIKPIIQKYHEYFLWVFVAGNLLACLICWNHIFLDYYVTGNWNPYYSHLSRFLHPSYFALYLAFSVLFVWDAKLKEASFKRLNFKILLYWLLVIFFSLTILYLSSKAGIFAFVSMIFFLLGIKLFAKKDLLRNLILICLLLGTTVMILKNNQRMQNFSNSIQMIKNNESSNQWTSTTCRFHIWESALASLNDTLILGHGIGDSKDELIKEYKKKEYNELSQQAFDTHNQYLEIMLMCGLIGLIMVVLLVSLSLFFGLKANDSLMIGFIILIGIHMMVETMLTKSHGIMFYAFFAHLLWIKMDENTNIPVINLKRVLRSFCILSTLREKKIL